MRSTMHTVLGTPFRLDLVAPVPAPDGGDSEWHRYVITQGSNTITGVRLGTREEVMRQLDVMIENLNVRLGKQQAKQR
jgi:hypothetical protein